MTLTCGVWCLCKRCAQTSPASPENSAIRFVQRGSRRQLWREGVHERQEAGDAPVTD